MGGRYGIGSDGDIARAGAGGAEAGVDGSRTVEGGAES